MNIYNIGNLHLENGEPYEGTIFVIPQDALSEKAGMLYAFYFDEKFGMSMAPLYDASAKVPSFPELAGRIAIIKNGKLYC